MEGECQVALRSSVLRLRTPGVAEGREESVADETDKNTAALAKLRGQCGHVFVCLLFQAVEFSLCQPFSIHGKSYLREYFVKVYEVQVMGAC
jgi:hypothetical protein